MEKTRKAIQSQYPKTKSKLIEGKTKERKPCIDQSSSTYSPYHRNNETQNCSEVSGKIKIWNDMSSSSSNMTKGLMNFYESNPEEFLKNLKNGPPAKYRWAAWKVALNIDKIYTKSTYSKLLNSKNKSKSRFSKQIEADAQYAFNDISMVTQRNSRSEMCTKLKNVLSAVFEYLPEISYLKGMSQLISFILIVSDMDDEDTFWAFVALIKGNLSQDPIRSYGIGAFYNIKDEKKSNLNKYFDALFDNKLHDLKMHFKKINLSDSLWIQRWAVTMCISYFPYNYCLRFWDYMLSEGLSKKRCGEVSMIKVAPLGVLKDESSKSTTPLRQSSRGVFLLDSNLTLMLLLLD